MPRFVLMVFTLAAASACAALPATGSVSPSGSREPVVEVETAIATKATVAPEVTATAAATGSPLPTPTPVAPTLVAPTLVASASATAEATAAPAATATAAPSSVPPGATTSAPATYRGPNPYRATPAFEVTLDPAAWEYVEDDGSGRQSQLKHRTIDGCTVWLRAGPVDAQKMADVWLAGRAWSLSLVQPKVIQYVSPQDDFAWIFGVLLPEEWSGRGNSSCQDAAEQVIGTFRVVTGP